MKNILCTTLLVAGLAGNVFVYGQVHREGTAVGRPNFADGDSVWIEGPDRMPCVVLSPAKVERMPVKKLDIKLVSPMPNGVPDGGPHVQIVPRRKE